MLRRVGLIITAVCVIICFLGPIFIILIDVFVPPFHRVIWNADGSSIGIYQYYPSKLLVRRFGYGPSWDGDTLFDPWVYTPFFTMPPVIWFWLQRRVPTRRGQRFASYCAACPLVVATLVAYRRRNETLAEVVVFAAFIILLIAGIVKLIKRIPSVAERRFRKGLCPNCAYDIRATPDPLGPRLSRCPECGVSFTVERASRSD